jgi:hypothetical protein
MVRGQGTSLYEKLRLSERVPSVQKRTNAELSSSNEAHVASKYVCTLRTILERRI